MEPQNPSDGKHPDGMIKDLRALLHTTQDATQRAVIYSGTQVFIKHKSRKNMYLSDEQLHSMELFVKPSIKVQVEGLECEIISRMCRCTGSLTWREGDRGNDWGWVKQRSVRCYGALNGSLPWQLE
jgi:hypothetical protein